jgi:hypothetical protein
VRESTGGQGPSNVIGENTHVEQCTWPRSPPPAHCARPPVQAPAWKLMVDHRVTPASCG